MTLDATNPPPIERRSLHSELVDRLRSLIVEGRFPPDTKIPERELCETFRVSRTPMREALKVLASEGLLVLEPNRGAWMANVTLAELETAFPVLAALEALAGELACQRITDAQLRHLRERHEALVRHHRDGDRPKYFKANQDIHDAILEAADNEVLTRQHRAVAARIWRARFMANDDAARWDQAVAEHGAIQQALEARDGDRLPALLKQHMLNKLASLQRAAERDA